MQRMLRNQKTPGWITKMWRKAMILYDTTGATFAPQIIYKFSPARKWAMKTNMHGNMHCQHIVWWYLLEDLEMRYFLHALFRSFSKIFTSSPTNGYNVALELGPVTTSLTTCNCKESVCWVVLSYWPAWRWLGIWSRPRQHLALCKELETTIINCQAW